MDLAGERRLRDSEPDSRLGDGALLGDSNERPQMAQSTAVRLTMETACSACESADRKMAERTQIQLKAATHMFSRNPSRFTEPVALAFVGRMPDARSVRASATRGGRE